MSSRAEEKERRRRERLAKEAAAASAARRKRTIAIVAAVIVAAGVAAGVVIAVAGGGSDGGKGKGGPVKVGGTPTSSDPFAPGVPFARGAGAEGQTVDGTQCLGSEQLAFHVHSHVDVFVNGRRVAIPANVGILGKCLYWLHTHDPTGVLHIESPEQRKFTLGTFFDIWGAPLSKREVLTWAITKDRPLAIYVNGKKFTGDPASLELGDGKQITIVIGRPPKQIPKTFDFSNA